ncbi:MAG: DNA polymerase IV [Nitrospira sp.]|nr:DNA polymerase IV [Nitrospira sp.]MDH4371037.1 DNA polymerase IV [Nitrospira sp.]MDH5346968.1 DNA polymerase IV [Nitrospira sp.]MDH5498380.1 DNA polymerase IV [Nitrospira sp.]MDH5724546.1 DNA polymerase IV [Nitrospira sp.]
MLRIIAHLDMDAFFASIEERDTPAFRGVPLVVGADPLGGKGRGVASTSNYLARAYGIHSATPISMAWRLSEAARHAGKPPVTFVSVDMPKYARVSEEVMQIVRRFISKVEQASIDEAYGDVSWTESYEEAERICRQLKEAITTEVLLTASVGIGPNKLVAKIASGWQKPSGLTVVREDQVETFLAPLPIRVIPGIGPKTEAKLRERGIKVINDLRRLSMHQLEQLLGKRGVALYNGARGWDDYSLEEYSEPKSIGEQKTFESDTLDSQALFTQLARLARGVSDRLSREDFKAFQTVVLTVRFADFETKSRAHTVAVPTGDLSVLQREGLKLLMPFLDRRENPRRKLIRLLGLRVEKLI